MYQTLADLVLDSDNLTDVSKVVAMVNQALRRTAKHQVKAIGTDGTDMATDEEREQALQSAFPDPDRVIETAAAVADLKKAAAARPVKKQVIKARF